MKVGDLVTYMFQRTRWLRGQSVDVGLIVETGKYAANCDVKVMWTVGTNHGKKLSEKSSYLSLVEDINENR